MPFSSNKKIHIIEAEEHRPSVSSNFNFSEHELLAVGLVRNDDSVTGGNAAESRQITAAIILDEDDFIYNNPNDQDNIRSNKRMKFESSPLMCPRLWSPDVAPFSLGFPKSRVSNENVTFQMSHFQHAPLPKRLDESSDEDDDDESSVGEE